MHNTSARWIKELKEEHKNTSTMQHHRERYQEESKKDGKLEIPRPRQEQIFWLKCLTSLHGRLAEQLQEILNKPDTLQARW